MKEIKIRVINNSKHPLPQYATELSAGMDLRANIDAPLNLAPGQRALVPTGLRIELPAGYEAQIRPRSGNALKLGLHVHLGTIDSDYRGEVGVILVNLSDNAIVINDGDRVAQMVVAKHERVEWIATENLSSTERGEGGYGHTGTN